MLEGELKGFGLSLTEEDLARISLEKEAWDLECKRVELEREDRQKDRALRHEDREAQNELELQNFKIMIRQLMQARK